MKKKTKYILAALILIFLILSVLDIFKLNRNRNHSIKVKVEHS